ncbi:hypothetical protein A3I48_01105 [Candidatus Daviesbacteria bacterium RIFCSPLOWO2_02_FULL_36_7]|uniref:Short-chain dehydrogenase n=1 Tax=Candidatus Daviesbacteria bacterium RIFCSPLOWO2_02_FULL_36_7 TaxID=1797792 RepID=A0A1F5MHI3_9BACT|nr:MAG: hypothetical protein A3I48_01105 [Candidatus Daviesbacteria bacterium RIFCSPLOWO2_02_FULL_36_7]
MSKVAVIFGGSGGIGQAICSEFTKQGIRVYSTLYHKIATKQNPHEFHCDITKNKDIKSVISYVIKRESEINIVINSVTPPLKLKTIENLSTKEFKQDIDTILIGGINIAKVVIPLMKAQRGGLIINILSSLVLGNLSTRMSSYTSAKYGLLGFTKCLALELLPFNISVFGISPTFVETNLINAFPNKLIEMEKGKRKDRKLIQPMEVSKLALHIVQNPKKYTTGENIEIN